MSCGVGHRHSLDPALLWLWCSPAAAAPIQPLAWEPPCAVAVALRPKKKNTKELQLDSSAEFYVPGTEPTATQHSTRSAQWLQVS